MQGEDSPESQQKPELHQQHETRTEKLLTQAGAKVYPAGLFLALQLTIYAEAVISPTTPEQIHPFLKPRHQDKPEEVSPTAARTATEVLLTHRTGI